MGARREQGWLAFAAAGLVSAVAYLLLPRHTLVSAVLDDAGGFACAAAVVAGVRRHRPARRAPWYLFALAQACFGIGDVLWTVYADVLDVDPFPSLADGFYLGAYPLFALGLFLLIKGRTPGRDVAGLLDAAIIASGLGLLSWTFVMRPIEADESLSPFAQAVSLAYPLADVLLIGLLARLVTTPGARTRSYQLLTVSLGFLLAADIAYAVLNTLTEYDGGLTDAAYILAYTAGGAAALHPSMRSVDDSGVLGPSTVTFGRFALLGVTTLIAPGVLLQEGLTEPSSVDWLGVAVGALVLFLLILARVWHLIGRVQQQARQLDAVAHQDALTGVPNRRAWDLELPRALAAAGRSGADVAVAILDLDHFKRFNDLHGHPAGDALLVQATANWQAMLRTEDLLARYGGEEFCLLMTGASVHEAVATLRRLQGVTPRGQRFSAGLALWDGAEGALALTARADEALYRAKREGRDRIAVAGGGRVAGVLR